MYEQTAKKRRAKNDEAGSFSMIYAVLKEISCKRKLIVWTCQEIGLSL